MKSREKVLIGLITIFALLTGVLFFNVYSIRKENARLNESIADYEGQLNDQSKTVVPTKFLVGDKQYFNPYTPISDKVSEYDWYPGIITEFNYCNTDSPIFDNISSYSNPIDLAYMEYLDGRGISCQVARRGYQEIYYIAWRKEFYHVASMIYNTIDYDKEKKDLVTYVKSTEKMISGKQDEMVIDIDKCNKTPADQRWPSMYYGNATFYWQEEEAALIYRKEALNMIRQYDNYLYDNSEEKTDYDKAKKYEYLVTTIEKPSDTGKDSTDGGFIIPEYFK